MYRVKHQILAYWSRNSRKYDGLEIFQPSCKIFIFKTVFKVNNYLRTDFCVTGKEPIKSKTNILTTKIEQKQKVNRIRTLEVVSHDAPAGCQTHCHPGPQQSRRCLQRAECN